MSYYNRARLSHEAWMVLLPYDFDYAAQTRAKQAWGNCCAYCGHHLEGMPIDVGWDHFIPVDVGLNNPGTVAANMLPCCKDCNNEKGWSYPSEWLISKYGATRGQEILDRIHAYFANLKEDTNDNAV